MGDDTVYLVSHRMAVTVHIHIATKIEDLERHKTELRTAVLGWNPGADEGWDDMEHLSGSMLNIKGGIAWWEEQYRTWVTLREAYAQT